MCYSFLRAVLLGSGPLDCCITRHEEPHQCIACCPTAAARQRARRRPCPNCSSDSPGFVAGAGRVFALEMAFFVSTETVSGLLGGLMFDNLQMRTQAVAGVMAIIAAVIAVRCTLHDECCPTVALVGLN